MIHVLRLNGRRPQWNLLAKSKSGEASARARVCNSAILAADFALVAGPSEHTSDNPSSLLDFADRAVGPSIANDGMKRQSIIAGVSRKHSGGDIMAAASWARAEKSIGPPEERL